MRIQYKDVLGDVFKGNAVRNEQVVRVQPNEGVHLKVSSELHLVLDFKVSSDPQIMIKTPGTSSTLTETEMYLTYKKMWYI